MNKKYSVLMGILSSSVALISTILLTWATLVGNNLWSFITSFGIAVSYLILANSIKTFVSKEKKVFANIAISIATVYCTFASIIYFTQLVPTVRLQLMSEENLKIFANYPGSLFFALDMLGYAYLCLSLFFVALAIKKGLLKTFLYVHTILFLIPTFCVPFLKMFYTQINNTQNSEGSLVLVGWGIVFIPICFLFLKYFWDKKKLR